jgi:hypothetical protein
MQEFHNILYGRYAAGDCYIIIVVNVLHTITRTIIFIEIVRWDFDDALNHDLLRMRTTYLTLPNLI